MAFLKTPFEKLQTKIEKVLAKEGAEQVGNEIIIQGTKILEYNEDTLSYTQFRFYETRDEKIVETNLEVTFILTHQSVSKLGTVPVNPPRGTYIVEKIVSRLSGISFSKIIIGSDEIGIENNTLSITIELYDYLINIEKEESIDKRIKVNQRVFPRLRNDLGIEASIQETERDYSLLIEEIIHSGQLNEEDFLEIASQLGSGNTNEIVIKNQINKQAEWLIEKIEKILAIENLTKPIAQTLGNDIFGFTKRSITGPEHLMERILSKYGQSALFGVPALLNTDKYVINPRLSRSQFDLILINHLGDIEIIELKRPDDTLLNYDSSRSKFYPSKNLSVAISQCERYISAAYRDNDQEYLINGRTIREFIQDNVGDQIFTESIRPTAIIIMGSWQRIHKPYSMQTEKVRNKISEQDYNNEGDVAYREIKNSFKNIKIMNYAELLNHARTRLLTENDD